VLHFKSEELISSPVNPSGQCLRRLLECRSEM